MIVVTSENIAGKRVVRTLGLVRGNTIRARHIGKDIMAGLRNVVGGEVHEYAKLIAERSYGHNAMRFFARLQHERPSEEQHVPSHSIHNGMQRPMRSSRPGRTTTAAGSSAGRDPKPRGVISSVRAAAVRDTAPLGRLTTPDEVLRVTQLDLG